MFCLQNANAFPAGRAADTVSARIALAAGTGWHCPTTLLSTQGAEGLLWSG